MVRIKYNGVLNRAGDRCCRVPVPKAISMGGSTVLGKKTLLRSFTMSQADEMWINWEWKSKGKSGQEALSSAN